MGGLAGIAEMGMMVGAEEGAETLRIDGKTACLKTQGDQPEITVALDSGSILKLEAQGGVSGNTLKDFAEGLKISELDNDLRGSQAH